MNAEEHLLLHILLDGNIQGRRDLYILKTVINRDTQGVHARTSYLAGTIQFCNLSFYVLPSISSPSIIFYFFVLILVVFPDFAFFVNSYLEILCNY